MHRILCVAIASLLLISVSHATTLEEVLQNNGTLTNLLGNFQNLPGFQVPQEIATMENVMVHIEEAKQALKDKCKKESGDESAYDNLYQAAQDYKTCMVPLLDFSTIKDEMEEAQPKGDLDTVFNKYCGRRHAVINCTRTFTTKAEPCLNAKEKTNKNILVNMFVKALDFVCHKEGDQIALFIAEKGPECFKDKNEELQKCARDVLSDYVPKDKSTFNFKAIPTFDFDRTKCQDMETLSGCMVKVLEACEESTPANLVESMFRFVKNETPCKRLLSRQARSVSNIDDETPKSAAGSLHMSLALLGSALIASHFYH